MNAAWLAWNQQAGGNASAVEMHFPPDRYCCQLENQPDHLVPAALAIPGNPELGALHVNPDIWFGTDGLPDGTIPDGLETRDFASFRHAVWVRQPDAGIVLPFWLGPVLFSVLSQLRSSSNAPPHFLLESRQQLDAVAILIDPVAFSERRNRAKEHLWRRAEHFQGRGYVPVHGLIHPFHVSALRRYYRRLVRTRQFTLGDSQTPNRYVAHNDPVARFFHFQFTDFVSTLAGKPVKPSYVYVASYQDGSILEKHTDREQCEFSITYCLDYSPEPARETPWPIHLETKSADVKVFQAIGDALFYRGREIPHYRSAIPPKHTSTSIFFHYVDADFRGGLS